MRFFQTLLLVAMTQVLPALAAVKIMPFGDSITGSPGCWRAMLWQKLQQGGFTDIDFVGSLNIPASQCGGTQHDGDNEGHGGFLAINIANQNQLVGWLASTKPDIVLMHLGTNDVWNNRNINDIITAFSKLVDQMRASNPKMKIIVAQIIPMNAGNFGCSDCNNRVQSLNALIPAWAQSKSTTESPIVLVDQFTGFSAVSDCSDGVHPNDAGNRKMADKWYPALVNFLKQA